MQSEADPTQGSEATEEPIELSPRTCFRIAMALAILADGLQIVVFPLFGEGALSPVDDVLDVFVALALVRLVGWHWEFLPSLFAELLPGVDLVPFWTMSVMNVYRKWKQGEAERIDDKVLSLQEGKIIEHRS